MYEYKVNRIIRVVDGDTYDLELDLGFHMSSQNRYRLLGADTPELHGVKAQPDAAKAATAEASGWMSEAMATGTLIARTHKTDDFGRWLVELVNTATGEDLTEHLIEGGFAVPYVR